VLIIIFCCYREQNWSSLNSLKSERKVMLSEMQQCDMKIEISDWDCSIITRVPTVVSVKVGSLPSIYFARGLELFKSFLSFFNFYLKISTLTK
jgi:hypothetical protein